MTIAPERRSNDGGDSAPPPEDLVTLTIDDIEVSVPKGTLIIRAAEMLGIQIPRFCDHPLLDPVGACRQCIVEVEGQRKPLTACTSTVSPDMVVKTQLTSAVAEKAQQGTLEMLLMNHPLDCPVCDKGGECPLQNQALSHGNAESRFRDVKRTFPKPIAISTQVLLDRERCVLCARCTRFSEQIAGDPFIGLFERGALQQVAVYEDEPFSSYFSGNTVQICPVGALTGASYRFRSRPFDLVSTPTACEHCASGCSQRTDHRRGRVLRRLAGDDPEVNEEWNCDKGRWAFQYTMERDRITAPLIRNPETGEQFEVSWSDALEYAASGLREAAQDGGAAVLAGGRHTVEDAAAYGAFARQALGTGDVDFRIRPHSDEEAAFLRSHVQGRPLEVTYADLNRASAVLLVAFEPEEESPIVFLRLRKAARKRGLKVASLAPLTTPSVIKTMGSLIRCAPGDEPGVLDELNLPAGAVVLVGERLAEVPGGFSAVSRLAARTGARIAWIPRRAGERGAVEVGLLPRPGARDTSAIVAAAANGELDGLLVGAVDPADLPDPALAAEAFSRVPFVVSLELRHSAVTAVADVVFPVSPTSEKAGTFLDWEGRERPMAQALDPGTSLTDLRVLHLLASEMGVDLGLPSVDAAREAIRNGFVRRPRLEPGAEVDGAPDVAAAERVTPDVGHAVLTTWHWLLDDGRMQDGEPHLAGTRKAPRLHLSGTTAAEIGATPGVPVTVSTDRGSVTLPLVIADLPDRVVWLPTFSPGSHVRADLGASTGSVVRIAVAPPSGPILAGTSGASEASGAPEASAGSAQTGASVPPSPAGIAGSEAS
ncbi:MAG TPA: NADH-quinone oxidoreductase subunit G [Frankiaceae bacterium]|nr:NADH-quinone oxidoreductase subunit G [Frankiaceae bacterium]